MEIIESLEEGKKPGTYVTSDIFRICLPQFARKGTIKQEAKENETLISHVTFEAFLLGSNGISESAIAIFIRDKTHYVQSMRAMKKNFRD